MKQAGKPNAKHDRPGRRARLVRHFRSSIGGFDVCNELTVCRVAGRSVGVFEPTGTQGCQLGLDLKPMTLVNLLSRGTQTHTYGIKSHFCLNHPNPPPLSCHELVHPLQHFSRP